MLADAATNTARRKDFDALLGIEPYCGFTNWANVNTGAATNSIGPITRFIIDFGQTDLNIINDEFLQSPAWTYLHAFERITDNARLMVWIDIRRASQIRIRILQRQDGFSRAGVNAVATALAGVRECRFWECPRWS